MEKLKKLIMLSNLEITAWLFALAFITAIGCIAWYCTRRTKKTKRQFFNLQTGRPVTSGKTDRRHRGAEENDYWLHHQSTIGTLDTSSQDDKCSSSSGSRSDCSGSSSGSDSSSGSSWGNSGSSSFGGSSSFSSSGGGSSGSSFD